MSATSIKERGYFPREFFRNIANWYTTLRSYFESISAELASNVSLEVRVGIRADVLSNQGRSIFVADPRDHEIPRTQRLVSFSFFALLLFFMLAGSAQFIPFICVN